MKTVGSFLFLLCLGGSLAAGGVQAAPWRPAVESALRTESVAGGDNAAIRIDGRDAVTTEELTLWMDSTDSRHMLKFLGKEAGGKVLLKQVEDFNLVVYDNYKKNLLKDDRLRNRLKNYEIVAKANYYVNFVLAERAKKDVDQKAFEDKLRFKDKKIRARIVVLPSRAEAQKVLEEIRKGADFGETARSRSILKSAAEGGDVGYLYYDSGLLPEQVDTLIFSSAKEGFVSEVFDAALGYCILRVEEIRPVSQEEMLERVQGLVAKQVDVLVAGTLERLREKEKIEIDNGKLEGIARQKDPSRLLSDTSGLATVGGTRVLTKEFADFLINMGGGKAEMAPALFDTYAKYLILNKAMEKEGYALPKKQANIMVFREKKLMYEHYVEREKAKVKYKEKDIKEFFGRKKSDYGQKEGIDFSLIFSRSEEIMKTVATSLREGRRTFDGLAQEFSEDGSKKNGGRVGFAEKEKVRPFLWDELARLKDGETSEPVKEGDGYYLLKRHSYRPGKDAELSSVKDRVRSDYVSERYGAIFQDYLAGLRTLYPVERNAKVLERVFNAEEGQDKPGKEKEG